MDDIQGHINLNRALEQDGFITGNSSKDQRIILQFKNKWRAGRQAKGLAKAKKHHVNLGEAFEKKHRNIVFVLTPAPESTGPEVPEEIVEMTRAMLNERFGGRNGLIVGDVVARWEIFSDNRNEMPILVKFSVV